MNEINKMNETEKLALILHLALQEMAVLNYDVKDQARGMTDSMIRVVAREKSMTGEQKEKTLSLSSKALEYISRIS